MEISSILVGLGLFSIALFFVSAPFRQKRQKIENPSKVHKQEKGRREIVLAALRDLDFDFKTGKVSEEDYQPLRAQLLAEAVQYIEAEKQEDERLEALIQTRRKAEKQDVKCEHCGAPMEAGQRFCSKCGSVVNHELCPSCGKQMQASDLFCSSCGKKVEVRLEAVTQS